MKLGSKNFLKEDLQDTLDEELPEKAPTLKNSDMLNRKSNETNLPNPPSFFKIQSNIVDMLD